MTIAEGSDNVSLVCRSLRRAELGQVWRPLCCLVFAVAVASSLAIMLYRHNLGRAEEIFLLKYVLASQSAILWMSMLFLLATACYAIGILQPALLWLGSTLTWGAVFIGATGMFVRWHESYLMGAEWGHLPFSNLYEVLVLFALITALFYLYYEYRYQTRALGGLVLGVISAAVIFLLWYAVRRNAAQIQPLVPALKSGWMTVHVPANFISYGAFSLAAMAGMAYLVKVYGQTLSWRRALLGWMLAFFAWEGLNVALVLRHTAGFSTVEMAYGYGGLAILAAILGARRRLASALPTLVVLDDIMYRAIALGFTFFTLAIILGALWAADAWGAYWQWDPKETWALIVWLNYAAWLHMRLMQGLRGVIAASWALTGLLITGFAFLGVNMFLSGLHAYGQW